MSRKGKLPIDIPSGVTVSQKDQTIEVSGPKGKLELKFLDSIAITEEENKIFVKLAGDQKQPTNFQGLYRTLIDNMIMGVTKGFEKRLQMIGVGYRAAVKGTSLDLQVGVSHPMLMPIPAGISVEVEKNTTIIISGIDKQAIGQFAAQVRAVRPPEPYQGKGIRYEGEYVRRKAGKAAAKK